MIDALERRGVPPDARSHLEAALATPTGAASLETPWKPSPLPETHSTS